MNKILKDSEIEKIQEPNLILVGGCFDILHESHIKFLRNAKELGGTLVVLLESDENVKKLKGKNRPVNNQATRAKNLESVRHVDYVILLQTPKASDYYYNLVKSLKPAIIAVTNDDPLLEIKKDQAKLVGGRVVKVLERNQQHSSTKIIEKRL